MGHFVSYKASVHDQISEAAVGISKEVEEHIGIDLVNVLEINNPVLGRTIMGTKVCHVGVMCLPCPAD